MINKYKEKIQQEALECLGKNNYNGIAIAPTGIGKAYILIQALIKLNPKTILYTCDSTLNRDKTFKAELIKWGAEEFIHKIDFMCYQSAYKMHGAKYDLVLGDEFDVACTPAYSQTFLNNKFKHKVLVTATLSDDKRDLAKSIAPIVYEKGLYEIEGTGALNESKYYTVKYNLLPEENKRYRAYNNQFGRLLNTKPVNHFRLQQLQLQRKHFMSNLQSGLDVCRRLLKELHEDGHRKILVFCGLSKQADRVCKYSFHTGNEKENDNFNLFDKGDIRVLSVVGKIDRGVNINGVNTVIFESPSASATKWQQKSGRARRLEVDEVVDIYFLIPYYIDNYGKPKPTIVEQWVYQSVGKIDIKSVEHTLKYS